MIQIGINLEESQYVSKWRPCWLLLTFTHRRRLAHDIANLGAHATARARATIEERGNNLRRNIASWITVQNMYIPDLARLRYRADVARPDGVDPVKAQNIQLWLPSAIGSRLPVDLALCEYELRLREGQAHDALQDLRDTLRVRAHQYKYKDRNVRGVKHNTRTNSAIKKLDARISSAAAAYRTARLALVQLGPQVGMMEWERDLKVLKEEDVRGMSEALYGDSEGKRRLSWIWMAPGLDELQSTDPGMNEGMFSFPDTTPVAETSDSFTNRMVSEQGQSYEVVGGG